MRKALSDTADLLASPLAHERAARETTHRPWPPPRRSWVMAQTWVDLLFAHWRFPPEAIERAVPVPLSLQTHNGDAWLGITPFAVRNLRLRATWPLPLVSTFPEINVRTYVEFDGKPGIFFFSLDAGSDLAVAAARRSYRLPYFRARMSIQRGENSVDFSSSRREPRDAVPAAEFRATYRANSPPTPPTPGTLEHWLTERYCLYTLDDRRRVMRGEIHHPPWPLQHAEALIEVNTMTAELDLEATEPPLLHYSARQDVVFWSLELAQDD